MGNAPFRTLQGNIMSSRATLRLRRLKNLCLLLPAIVLAGDVSAQPASYPDKSVRIISDAAPGARSTPIFGSSPRV